MDTWFSSLGVIAIALTVGAGLTACGEDDPDANDDDNDNQHANAQNDDQLEICADGDPEFQANYDLLFNEFAFDDDSPGSELNGVIDEFMDDEDHPILVLVELAELDVEAGTVGVRGGAGLETDTEGEYRWDDEDEALDEPDSTEGTIDADGNLEAELPMFNFVATLPLEEEEVKTVIPIRELQLDAVLQVQDDGSNPCIAGGDLEGIVWYDDIEDVEIVLSAGAEDGIPLTSVLDENNMNYVYDGDEGLDAWQLEASFSAEETQIVE